MRNVKTENYLRLSWEVVHTLVRPGENNNVVECNKRQCALLKKKLLETVTRILLLADLDSLPPEKQALLLNCCKLVLLEFYRLVKNAEEIIQRCCSQDWLNAAIKLANNTEAFVDVFFELDWCTSVVSIIFSDAMSASELENAVRKIESFGEEEYRCKIEEIHNVFTEDALHDHLILRIRLYELLENTSLSPDQQEIATNLLKLLATHPADMREQKIQKIDLLLAIEPEKLAHISRIDKGAYGVVSKVKWLDKNVANYKSFKISSELKFKQEAEILSSISRPTLCKYLVALLMSELLSVRL